MPLPGKIEARDNAGNLFSVDVGSDGRIHMALPPGTYQVTGTSPLIGDGKARCQAAKPLHVAKTGKAATVLVICSIS